MSEHDTDGREIQAFREALRRRESARAGEVPSFASIRDRISTAPSALDRPRWSATRSLRLTGALARAQLRIVPRLILPVALLTAILAGCAARFLGATQDVSSASSAFSSMLLFGVVATVTMALSSAPSDAVSLSTPLGPQVVVLARVAVVLVVDMVVGTAASGVVTATGAVGSFGAVLAGWSVALAAVAGLVTFVAIWLSPWAGVLVGVLVIPFVGPRSSAATDAGLGALIGALREAITPAGLMVLGLVVLTGAVASARYALTEMHGNPSWS